MVNFPAGMPRPLLEAEFSQAFDNILKSQQEYGRKRRRRFTFVPELITYRLNLTTAQRLTLRDFFLTTVKEVNEFQWREFSRPNDPACIFVFDQAPEFTPIATNLWQATLKLELRRFV